ncbi:hypothetical protein K461DRAFT_230493 [Myriangium duriaei CBS 260.36]|uniref:SPIN90/Ldb17 leucine-rich domain-containing protein n=1 Tax=Myriangium duriaei CBS 260.36 TaxID=1168546 RepID=A0A9P4IWY9_9PEZI|nr:hypothetical protein K461DRAFT_230493 [Myriangium duriaei CBS 260.36]
MDNEEEERFDSPEQFVARIKEICSIDRETHEEIDDGLRDFITAVSAFHRDHDVVEDHVQHGCFELLTSGLFKDHRDYVRRQFIHSLIQEDEYPILQIMTTFLLYDGRSDEETFMFMQREGLFPRLLELIKSGRYDETPVHTMLLELLCEITRIQQLSRDDLQMVDDAFVLYLFQLIEQLSDDASDPYHFAIVRILLVINEQYMCFSQDESIGASNVADPLPNRIIKILSSYGPAYRTFGENLILLLNRQTELGPQLLILKVLYLLFTNPPTFEYFYTNDLHVLVDVILRNLLDLDPSLEDDDSSPIVSPQGVGQRALRHTYLRVLYPLLKNTQLAGQDGNYKRDELRRVLRLLASSSSQHFAPADSTVVRLVTRCRQIDWLHEASDEPEPESEHEQADLSPMKSPPSDTDVAKRLLGMNNIEAGISSLSVLDVTAKVEKEEKKQRPLVPPRRRGNKKTVQLDVPAAAASAENGKLKVKPMIPKPRRSRSEQLRDQSPFSDRATG